MEKKGENEYNILTAWDKKGIGSHGTCPIGLEAL